MGAPNLFARFRAHGMTAEGALAMIGNAECESNCCSFRVQSDFSSGYAVSQQYTARVDSGAISREEFVEHGPGGGGYGLFQWTWQPRKEALYDFARSRGVSIGLEDMQIDYAVQELKSDFSGLWSMLCTSTDLYELTRLVCEKFEKPEVKNTSVRSQQAQRWKEELSGGEPLPTEPDTPDDPDSPFWPPRQLCAGMNGADVMALQALLIARGYHTGGVSGIFDTRTHNTVMAFQAESGLEPDGIAGRKTWAALLSL